MEKQNSFVRFMLLFGIMLIVTQLAMRWLGIAPEPPSIEDGAEQPAEVVKAEPLLVGEQEEVFVALGSYDPAKGEKYLAYFNSQGATLDRVELVERDDDGELKYGVIEFKHGYLGYLAPLPIDENGVGVKVRVVGDGTPAHLAGIQVGDVLTSVHGTPLASGEDIDKALRQTVVGERVEVKYERGGEAASVEVELADKPLQVIDPQPYPPVDPGQDTPNRPDNSLRTTLTLINDQMSGNNDPANVPSLMQSNWSIAGRDERTITFQLLLDNVEGVVEAPEEIGDAGSEVAKTVTGPLSGQIEVSKTYSLAQLSGDQSYHIGLNLAFTNKGDASQRLALRQYGPNSIVNESWWTSVGKTRDVKWSLNGKEDEVRAATILEFARENKEEPSSSIWKVEETEPTLNYLVTDSQFFAAGFVDAGEQSGIGLSISDVRTVLAEPIEGVTEKSASVPNTSFFIDSDEFVVPAGATVSNDLRLFVGPKLDGLLQFYGMDNVIEYGWFRAIARPLSGIMHFFQKLVGNYGVAIIMLTILVRGCMHPLSRKQVRGTQMMGFLKPQMTKINEKYKDDPRQKTMKQQQLFAKYGYNPLAGCLPVFVQMPIFFGLYRSIMVDVELRGQALLPGLDWCTNLAGPDMLQYFGESTSFLINRGGLVGPYLNLLPLLTIFLFLLQQKIYTPPATDDTQRMAQRMMKFMFLFMGFMFFRVASGLCIYFIASSTWGILERKLLPKIADPDAYLEKLAEERRLKKKKPGFMARMMEMAENQKRSQASGDGNSERRKQLDSLRGGRRRR
ncbi:MAG: YidC/Oxa1 family insertase periplasmic-domain containing protein [Pirellulales bacterium]|nr:YidC/Oxa1 family insertase periplasmic-domain containing protein [Pirellulales bacterium]